MPHSKPTWILLFGFLSCLNQSLLTLASNQISNSNPLSGNSTIISQNGYFELGFFALGNKTTSSNYYLGIWYKKLPQLTPVWIANRNTPISDPSASELRISADGNLVLIDQSRTQIWSTDVSSINSSSTLGELLDSGNFVLRKSKGSNTSFLWESMDHPTDTVLPTAKFGKTKNGRQKLISWKNSLDPAEGLYSLEFDPNGSNQFLIFWNRSKPFWSSGEWNGKFFSNLPEMNANFDSGRRFFKFVSDENETYFTYWIQKDSVMSRFQLDISGQMKPMTWLEMSKEWHVLLTQPPTPCDVYASCGPFGICNEQTLPYCSCVKGFKEVNATNWALGAHSEGCQRSFPLKCTTIINSSMSNGQTDNFAAIAITGLPTNSYTFNTNSIKDCEKECLQNCSCIAYAYSNSCSLWYGDLLNLHESDGSNDETLYVRLSALEFEQTRGQNKLITWVVIGSAMGLLTCVIVIFLLVRKLQKRKLNLPMDALESSLFSFRYEHLRRMTNNFSELLGRGSFGLVFKGTLPNSSTIAVKRLEGLVQVGEKQFQVEVSTVGIIQHVNLVRLRGFCFEREKRLLIYDYMPNGSLDKHLFRRNSSTLSWNTRYQIALGVACGLSYLHESCLDCIIHCDIKPENILLDEWFIPKIADFGMAKLVGRDFSTVLTTLKGTIGYLAPEWISGMPISAKADVYSYGMVLLEIVSGQRNSLHSCDGGTVGYFPLAAAIEINEGNTLALLDQRLNGDANVEQVERMCRVACWCIQDEEHNRPTMGQVVQILEGLVGVSVPPIPRFLNALVGDSDNLDVMRLPSVAQSWPAGSVASTITQF